MSCACVALAARREALLLLSLPYLTPETEEVILQADLSPEWAAFSEKYALLRREGESPLQIPLAAGMGTIPKAFFENPAPFYLEIMGKKGKDHMSTNQVCGVFAVKP